MQKSGVHTFAAIDIGSNAIRMAIAQMNSGGELSVLEDMTKATNIGRDTFSYGRVQVESINESCWLLQGFSRVMQEYAVKDYRAVCTSGIREAENREYVLDQIRLKTGLVPEVINNAQERFLMYKAVRDSMQQEVLKADSGTLITDIRSGGVEVSVYDRGLLKFTEYIKIGSLRLREILSELERKTLQFPSVMEQFVQSRIDFLKPRLQGLNVDNFVGLGGELRTISGLCRNKEAGERLITKIDLEELYHEVHPMTTSQIISRFGLKKYEAEIVLPSIILFYSFINMTGAAEIKTPMVSLRHGLLSDMADRIFDRPGKAGSIEDVISSVWYIAGKYSIDEVHSANIESLALEIFDKTERIHRLDESLRLLLSVAAILHDAGKYVNINQHDMHSYNIIRSQDIMGFSDRELLLAASVARYHSEEIPKLSHENYLVLTEAERIIVSKLACMLKVAEALDISHKQKIRSLNIRTSGQQLVFEVKTSEDILLEEWSFQSHVNFFEEVMGIRPVIRQKG